MVRAASRSMVNAWLAGLLILICSYSAVSILPINCPSGAGSCTLQNDQGIWHERKLCRVASVAYPKDEAELIAAVANAVRKQQKIKVVSKLAHSLLRIACPGGDSGLLISTSRYNSTIAIDKKSMTVTADAGVQLQDLLDSLAEHNLALPCTPTFKGLSVSGVISTGAHGSSLHGKGGAVHEYVSGIRIVVPATKEQGYAKVMELRRCDEDLNAARLSIGVLGAISQVTLDVEPMFKRIVTKQSVDDTGLEDAIASYANQYTFPELSWYLSNRKMVITLSDKVPASRTGDGRNTNFYPAPASVIRQARVQDEKVMSQMNSSLLCARIVNATDNQASSGDGFVNDETNTFKSWPVVGFNHRMQASGGCQLAALNGSTNPSGDKLTCFWDPDVPAHFLFQTSIIVPISKLRSAILDLKKFRDRNYPKICAVHQYGGADIRFVKGSSAYLAQPEDSMVFELLYFRDRRANTPTLNQDVPEEIEQMLLRKYNGRPHWGKNKNSMFEDIGSRVTNLPKFVEVMRRFDPEGYFSSEWSDAVLGVKRNGSSPAGISVSQDYCALEGLCVCKEDRHCAPDQGYLCKHGAVFTEARVCRKDS